MIHPVLGELREKEVDSASRSASVAFGERQISVDIDPDGEPLEVAVALAAKVVSSLESLEVQAGNIIVRDLLDTYNGGWNEYDEVQEDGSLKAVQKPELSAEEFSSHFVLDSIQILGDACVDFWYPESDLFWGHSVHVSSLQGADFSDAQAQLFG
jgi:hypothetical protein